MKKIKMKKIKMIMAVIMALVLAAGLAACTSEPSTSSSSKSSDKDKKLKVGFSAGYSMVQHWELEMNGCQAAADENGVEFIYQFADGDEQKQVADIETMVEMGIDMLIVGPANSEGIVPTVEELKGKGIPVMTSDIGISGTEVEAHVASDNYEIGVLAADYLGKKLDGKGKVAIVGWAAASATKDREDGFVDTLTEKYPGIEITSNQDVGGDRTKSLEKSENILQSTNDLDAIFGCNAECAMGAYGATQSLGRTTVEIVSVDTDSEVMEAIKNDTNMVATIAQNPYKMGYEAMSTAIKHLKGEAVKDIATPVEVVTVDNVQDIIDRDTEFLGK